VVCHSNPLMRFNSRTPAGVRHPRKNAYLAITPGTYRSASPAVLALTSSRNCLWSTVKPGWGDVTQGGRLTDRCVVQPGTCAPRYVPVSAASAPLATKTSRAAAAPLCNSLIIVFI
jgi:hypothetical protein